MKKEKRVAIAVPAELNDKLAILAKLEGNTTAALARRILSEYADTRSDAIKAALKADAAYKNSLEQIRGKFQE